MNLSCRHASRALLTSMVLSLACQYGSVSTYAQNGNGAGQPQDPRIPRPQVLEHQVQIDPELQRILKNWELAGKETTKLEGRHRRYIYDSVFFVEKWAEGEFYYESPDKGRIDLDAPKNFKEGQKRERNGQAYTIQKDKAERWVCDGMQVLAIDEDRKEFQRFPIPVENRGQNIADGPLPFLFGISEEKIRMRYHITLHNDPAQGGQHNLQAGIIHLRVKPLWQQDAANWSRAEVMLDAKSYLPKAIRLIHPGENAETVYVFYDVKRNAGRGVFALWRGSPFEPKLTGYKEQTTTAMEPTERR